MARIAGLALSTSIGLAAAAVLGSTVAYATEHGLTNGPLGLPTVFAAVMPPPGATQFFNYTVFAPGYEFDDDDGHSTIHGFHSTGIGDGMRFVHTWDVDLGGFSIGSSLGLLATYISNHASFPAPPPIYQVDLHDRATGISNLAITPVYINRHFGDFTFLATGDVFVPIGEFDKNAIANNSLNYWTVGGSGAVTWQPSPRFETSAQASVQFNFKNSDTDYRSGDVFNIDYGINWSPPITPEPALWIGVGGNFAKQFTDDKVNGVAVPDGGGRLQEFSIGPQATLFLAPNVAVQAKWQHLLATKNTVEGDRFWLSFSLPLDL
jgi:hypothetical protein